MNEGSHKMASSGACEGDNSNRMFPVYYCLDYEPVQAKGIKQRSQTPDP